MSKATQNPTRSLQLLEPLAAIAAIYIGGNTSAETFRLQVIATVVSLSEEDLKELAQIIVECR